jgi:hypothetical protein
MTLSKRPTPMEKHLRSAARSPSEEKTKRSCALQPVILFGTVLLADTVRPRQHREAVARPREGRLPEDINYLPFWKSSQS